MTCETFNEFLDDYVDGARAGDRPGDARRAEFESHLTGCERCQALAADFSTIRRTAATLEERVPPPRLWTKIASSVNETPRRFSPWIPLAVAASLAVVIAGAAWLSWRPAPPAPAPQQTSTSNEAQAAPAEAQYEQAIAGLQQLAAAQNATLDPRTREVLQQNLAAIDRAINESRAALADEPASALAQDSLLDALDTKVALLQDTVALAAEDVNQ